MRWHLSWDTDARRIEEIAVAIRNAAILDDESKTAFLNGNCVLICYPTGGEMAERLERGGTTIVGVYDGRGGPRSIAEDITAAFSERMAIITASGVIAAARTPKGKRA